MKKWIVISCLFLPAMFAIAQVPEPQPATINMEQELENATGNNEDWETEDDSYLQQMNQLQKNPVNINNAEEYFFRDLRLLTPMQIRNFLAYRSLMGKLISIYELQAVPGWDIATIQKVRPFIIVSDAKSLLANMKTRLRDGDKSILARLTQTLEKSRGYLDSSSAKKYYPGSPQRLFVRYKFTYRNLLQYGVLGEKDAGEEFFKGSQKKGFDFYSAHFFVRDAGIVRSLALGDFTVNIGQGLTQWMSLAFNKGPDITYIKRQSAVLRPYNSAGELLFHRGAGITIGKNNWQATVFGSLRNVDANLNTDTSNANEYFISSLQASGLHRTNSELEDKRTQRQFAFGGILSYQLKRLHIGLNTIQFRLKHPLIKPGEPYNLYALSGKSFGNYSTDYSYTYKNAHFFGEAALTDKKWGAFVNGLLLSVATNVDLSLFYRTISRGYQSLYANAFTENTSPSNETGLFAGIAVHPHSAWTINAYADVYRFPWLKYRVNKSTEGKDYMMQVSFKPTKQLEMYARYKAELKHFNDDVGGQTLIPLTTQSRKSWRTHLNYRINSIFTLRTRAEAVWFGKESSAGEEGFLLYLDLFYKPIRKILSGNLRLQYFETDGYNTRLYAYENDLLYSYSIPAFYDKGYRYYFNINYDLGKKISLWAKWAQFIYKEKSVIGTGLDEIQASHKSELKLQLMYKF
jgi:hypothetical protein